MFKDLILEMKSQGIGLMSTNQYLNIGETISLCKPCNLLVFGLGGDANVWAKINKNGRTAFIEDDIEWIKKFNESNLEIYHVEYNTKAEDHENIGFAEDKLQLNLHENILNTKWDVIFVDGPLGHNPPRPYKGPGRMKSIYNAYNLLKDDGVCIVDDIGRLIEKKYADYYFGADCLYKVIENKVGFYYKKAKK